MISFFSSKEAETRNENEIKIDGDIKWIVSKLIVNKTDEGNTLIIPVVIHVMHANGEENISDEQVLRQIEVLNEDSGRTPRQS